MKVIIAGSRTITDYELVRRAVLASGMDITEVVSGGAKGVDRLGEQWARRNQRRYVVFPADWARQGTAAGYKRNEQMALYAGGLVAVWDGVSPGTKHMIEIAKRNGLQVFCMTIPKETRPSGTLKVTLKYAGRGLPTPVQEEEN
jgi:glycerophosphoryl diester phosphodiesterase